VTVIGIGALAGLAEVGAIRAAQLLLGPLTVIYLGVSLAGLPEGIRALHVSKAKLRRACALWSAELAVCALGVGVFASILPDRFGTMLLGENWPSANTVVFPLSVSMAASGIIMGAGIGLRALAAARLSLRARLIVAPLVLVAALLGAATGGARGAAWGFAAAYSVGCLVWWRYFREALRQHKEKDAELLGRRGETAELAIPEVDFHA
jgi:O-antigen/teichoic acid export membrane protein